MGEFPPEFDCALTQIGNPGKLPGKALLHLYGQEMGLLPEFMDMAFKDAGKQRTWLVVGHKGQKDPALERLKKVKDFEEGIYWVFSQGSDNKKVVMEEILSKGKQGFHLTDQDVDSFFISLAQKLEVFPPLIISRPFTHLGQLLKTITPFPVPGQDKGFSVTDLLLLQTQGAIEQYQEVEVGAEDFGANQDTVFRRLAEAMGRPELADDPRYATHSARGERQAELDELIAEWTRTVDSGPLEASLHEHGVPAGNIYRAPEMLEDAHFKARDAIVRVADHTFGEIAMQNVAPKLSETPGEIRHAAPLLGEHNDEIYRGLLGLDEAEMARLKDDGVI